MSNFIYTQKSKFITATYIFIYEYTFFIIYLVLSPDYVVSVYFLFRFVQMSKMSSKISPIKCEPQNILTNIYIKQEYIDESVDRNDSYDCEFNFKW